jgi:hypothetical protein
MAIEKVQEFPSRLQHKSQDNDKESAHSEALTYSQRDHTTDACTGNELFSNYNIKTNKQTPLIMPHDSYGLKSSFAPYATCLEYDEIESYEDDY